MPQSRFTRFLVFGLFFGLLLSACSSKPADRLVDTWTIDNEAMMAENPEMKGRDNKMFSFEFTKDGRFIVKRGEKNYKETPATYTIKKTEGTP